MTTSKIRAGSKPKAKRQRLSKKRTSTLKVKKGAASSGLVLVSGIDPRVAATPRAAAPREAEFKFVDLFAGIGGMRRGFEAAGGRCVFTSEWDDYAQRTYRASWREEDRIFGDITQVDERMIPDHDVLVAGFPCQPFSIAGVSKLNSLGREHGFMNKTQGTLFFDVLRILKEKKPAAFLLENVKNLRSHNRGDTFKTILGALQNDLKYHVSVRIIDAKGYVPQHRERIFIAGFREDTGFDFASLDFQDPTKGPRLKDILHSAIEEPEEPYTTRSKRGKTVVDPKYTLSDKLWQYLQSYAQKHKAAGNGFGFGLNTPSSSARTLSARYFKDGSEILIEQPGKNPRRLTPRECARLMGFDPDRQTRMPIPVSDTRAYKQFGNAVVVPVVADIARYMKPHVMKIVGSDTSAFSLAKPRQGRLAFG
jgi:DNA (cytosine-5)-methyltransferase 1